MSATGELAARASYFYFSPDLFGAFDIVSQPDYGCILDAPELEALGDYAGVTHIAYVRWEDVESGDFYGYYVLRKEFEGAVRFCYGEFPCRRLYSADYQEGVFTESRVHAICMGELRSHILNEGKEDEEAGLLILADELEMICTGGAGAAATTYLHAVRITGRRRHIER